MDPQNLQPGAGQPDTSGIVPPTSGGDLGVGQQMATPDAAPQMATPEQRQGLLDMVEGLRQKLGSFHATQFAAKNKTERTRREILRNVFEILQLAGIDLTKRESVAEYLQKLRDQSPQLADWFESSMDVLLGGESTGFATPGDPNANMDLGIPSQNMNNQNQDENLSQNVPGFSG